MTEQQCACVFSEYDCDETAMIEADRDARATKQDKRRECRMLYWRCLLLAKRACCSPACSTLLKVHRRRRAGKHLVVVFMAYVKGIEWTWWACAQLDSASCCLGSNMRVHNVGMKMDVSRRAARIEHHLRMTV